MASKTVLLPAVVLLIALAFGSGDALQCYECIAIGEASTACNTEIIMKDEHSQVTCTTGTMTNWHGKVQKHPPLYELAQVFAIDSGDSMPQQNVPMSCVKITLRVDNQPVTLKTCQDSKSPGVDPCQTIRNRITQDRRISNSTMVKYCGLCEGTKCNGSYILSPTMILSIIPLLGSILMNLVHNSA